MHWLLIGYMFLFIDRPFEVWPWLGDLRIERIYMLFTMGFWALFAQKRWLGNIQHLAYGLFALAVVACWVVSPWMQAGQPKVEDWFKIVVFYVLLVTSVHDERGLKRLVAGFLAVMGLYLLHSFKEYLGGRHVFRMGIARMIGVDTTLGDPNSFGASIVFALPFVVCLWRSGMGGRWGKLGLAFYLAMSAGAILLTGSRSSLLGLLLWGGIMVLSHRKRWMWLTTAAVAAPLAFILLPDSLQNRFETIINSEAGPESARVSGEGRIHGLFMGFELWAKYPLTGAGPGAWIPATGADVESHSLIGQLVGEMGLLGVSGFAAMLVGFWWNFRTAKHQKQLLQPPPNDFLTLVPRAVMMSVFLLLFMGLFGHNLFRFSWLWYGGFLIIANYCAQERLNEYEQYGWPVNEADEDDIDLNQEANEGLPEGWRYDGPTQPLGVRLT